MTNLIDDLEHSLDVIGDLYLQKEIPEEEFCKMSVVVCLELFKAGAHDKCIEVLRSLPLPYFEDVQPKQMRADPTFDQISKDLANFLVKYKYVNIEKSYAFTQAPAKA
jgi:hypothetical protein